MIFWPPTSLISSDVTLIKIYKCENLILKIELPKSAFAITEILLIKLHKNTLYIHMYYVCTSITC